jgi:hypothetical protein
MDDKMTTVAAPTDPDVYEEFRFYRFVLFSIVGGITCVLGFVGNLMAFIVFQKDPKKTSTSFLFQVCGIAGAAS